MTIRDGDICEPDPAVGLLGCTFVGQEAARGRHEIWISTTLPSLSGFNVARLWSNVDICDARLAERV